MPGPMAKFAPTTVLVATFGYLGWSYFAVSPSPVPISKPPQITADMLRPAEPEETKRDPFGESVRFELGETKSAKLGFNRNQAKFSDAKPQGKPGTTRSQVGSQKTGDASMNTAAIANGGPATQPPAHRAARRAASTGSNNTSASTAHGNTVSADATLANLVLGATLLDGTDRVAMINNRAYRPGEPVDESTSEPGFRVAEIHHHYVVLSRAGQLIQLTYRDRPAESRTGAPLRNKAAGGGGPRRAKPVAERLNQGTRTTTP